MHRLITTQWKLSLPVCWQFVITCLLIVILKHFPLWYFYHWPHPLYQVNKMKWRLQSERKMNQDQELLSVGCPQTSDVTVQNVYPISPQSQVSRAIHTEFLAHLRLQKVSDQVPGTRARIQGAFSLPLKGKPQCIHVWLFSLWQKRAKLTATHRPSVRVSMRFSPAVGQTPPHSKVHFCSKSNRFGHERQICKGK